MTPSPHLSSRHRLASPGALHHQSSPRHQSSQSSPPSFRALVILGALTASLSLGCEGYIQSSTSEEDALSTCGGAEAPLPGARLLTRSEYRRTVRDLLHEPGDPTRSFPAEPEVDGFNNNSSSHLANPLLVEQFGRAAESLAQGALARGLDTLFPCEEPGSPCAASFIKDFGARAFRRPLDEEEALIFQKLYDQAAQTFTHDQALGTVVEAMLQSPQFLYRVEAPLGQDEQELVPLGPFELASRLSYFLWGTMPDEQLLSDAQGGRLETRRGVETAARRMLSDPKAKERVAEFHAQWLGLDELSHVNRTGAPPGAGPLLAESLETYLATVFWSEEPTVARLFTSPEVYVDASLAPLYGIQTEDTGMVSQSFPEERRGLLSQPGLLSLLSHSDQSSPIRRGVFVRERLLCAPVPAPPPNVNNNPPDPSPGLTTRERFAVHTEEPACAGCHELIDPVGFGFEGFDQLGRVRTEENGIAVDTSGGLSRGPDPSIEGPFVDINELSERLPESDVVLTCLTNQWFTFAMGRPHGSQDSCSILSITDEVEKSGGRLDEILIALVRSPSFRFRPAHDEVPE